MALRGNHLRAAQMVVDRGASVGAASEAHDLTPSEVEDAIMEYREERDMGRTEHTRRPDDGGERIDL